MEQGHRQLPALTQRLTWIQIKNKVSQSGKFLLNSMYFLGSENFKRIVKDKTAT